MSSSSAMSDCRNTTAGLCQREGGVMRFKLPSWLPPRLALVPPLVALLLQSLCWSWLEPLVWTFFFPAIFLSAWVGGRSGGLWGTALSLLLVDYYFIPPVSYFAIPDQRLMISTCVFTATGVLFSMLVGQRNKSIQQAAEAVAASRALIQQSEARMAGIVNSAMDAIISVNSDQIIVLFNAAAEAMFRYPATAALGQPLDRFIPPNFRKAHKHHVEGFGQTSHTSRSMHSLGTLTGVRADETEFPIEASISQVDVAGQKTYTVILRDITERKRAEDAVATLHTELDQRVIQRTAQLEAANQELESFSYSVSHDLRAPLRAMDGFSRALVEDFGPLLPQEGQRYLNTIRDSAQRMGELIDDLLTFSRLSRVPLSKRTIDTRRLVQASLDILAVQQDGREIEFQIGDLPPCEGDPALLKQVWVNLLSNAIKYTQKCDKAVIIIGFSTEPDGNAYFVRDNGTGFDMRYAAKLFGVFQRLHRAEDYPGTGVGLAIVQRIIHRHGGRIWVEAAMDRGATFHFTLEQSLSS